VIVELHFKDRSDEIVAEPVFLLAFDTAPTGRRDVRTLGELVQAQRALARVEIDEGNRHARR
jgi:hypothetical protein